MPDDCNACCIAWAPHWCAVAGDELAGGAGLAGTPWGTLPPGLQMVLEPRHLQLGARDSGPLSLGRLAASPPRQVPAVPGGKGRPLAAGAADCQPVHHLPAAQLDEERKLLAALRCDGLWLRSCKAQLMPADGMRTRHWPPPNAEWVVNCPLNASGSLALIPLGNMSRPARLWPWCGPGCIDSNCRYAWPPALLGWSPCAAHALCISCNWSGPFPWRAPLHRKKNRESAEITSHDVAFNGEPTLKTASFKRFKHRPAFPQHQGLLSACFLLVRPPPERPPCPVYCHTAAFYGRLQPCGDFLIELRRRAGLEPQPPHFRSRCERSGLALPCAIMKKAVKASCQVRTAAAKGPWTCTPRRRRRRFTRGMSSRPPIHACAAAGRAGFIPSRAVCPVRVCRLCLARPERLALLRPPDRRSRAAPRRWPASGATSSGRRSARSMPRRRPSPPPRACCASASRCAGAGPPAPMSPALNLVRYRGQRAVAAGCTQSWQSHGLRLPLPGSLAAHLLPPAPALTGAGTCGAVRCGWPPSLVWAPAHAAHAPAPPRPAVHQAGAPGQLRGQQALLPRLPDEAARPAPAARGRPALARGAHERQL